MTPAELLALGSGIALLALLSVVHLGGLKLLRSLKPKQKNYPNLGVVLTFWGLGMLHTLEIGISALALFLLLSVPGTGELSNGFGSAAADYLYFAGITFTSLGFTHLESHGAIRLLVMMLSLSGFMLITWSATFIYNIWGESFWD